jgi:ABC-type amino acid transport substrate-binding protein
MSSLLVLGLSVSTHSEADIGGATEQKETLKLAHTENFEPFSVVKEGKSEGLAIDIIAEALARVNLKVLFVGEHQDELYDLLLKGKVDGLAFLGISPERQKTYDFSKPYLMSGGALFVKWPNSPSFDLKVFEGRKVATPKKGPLAGYIEKNFPKIKALTDVKSYMETLQAVVDGKADAAALNTQSGRLLATQMFPGKFVLPERGFLEVPIGVGVLKGKQNFLLTKFNEGLKIVLSDGTYDKLVKKWGAPPATKPEKR